LSGYSLKCHSYCCQPDRTTPEDAVFTFAIPVNSFADSNFKSSLTNAIPFDTSQLLIDQGINKATSKFQRFIYNTENGKLFYDSDGSGKSEKVQIALFSNFTNLNANNFIFTEISTPTWF
jgi:hypothetical protein